MKKFIILAIITFIYFSFISDILFASSMKNYNFVELVNKSDLIVYGKIISIKSYKKEKGRIYSDIIFRVIRIYKGQYNDTDDISFTYLGGTLDGITTTVLEYPQFIQNQESILFLIKNSQKSNKQNKYTIIGLSQGKFNIYHDDKNNYYVIRDRFADYTLEIIKNGNRVYINNRNKIPLNDFISYLNYCIK